MLEFPLDKAKITAGAVISAGEAETNCSRSVESVSFYQSADALGAQYFSNFAVALDDTDGLKIRAKSPLGSLFRPGTIMTESCCFSTMCTLRHFIFPFKYTGLQKRCLSAATEIVLKNGQISFSARTIAGQYYHKPF